jgi:hypothetical protein
MLAAPGSAVDHRGERSDPVWRQTRASDRAAPELRVGEGAYALRSVPDRSSLFFSRLKAV